MIDYQVLNALKTLGPLTAGQVAVQLDVTVAAANSALVRLWRTNKVIGVGSGAWRAR